MNEPEIQVRPFRAEIRCHNKTDDHVVAFVELYTDIGLPFELIIEPDREDIDVSLFDVLDTKIDNFGLLHKG
jgi:hypothetical protein